MTVPIEVKITTEIYNFVKNEGYEFTHEFRSPEVYEWFLDDQGERILQCHGHRLFGPRLILRKLKPPQPKFTLRIPTAADVECVAKFADHEMTDEAWLEEEDEILVAVLSERFDYRYLAAESINNTPVPVEYKHARIVVPAPVKIPRYRIPTMADIGELIEVSDSTRDLDAKRFGSEPKILRAIIKSGYDAQGKFIAQREGASGALPWKYARIQIAD